MRLLSTVLIVVGLALILWTVVTWRFGDPITALWYRYEQHRLEAAYERRAAQFALPPSPSWTRVSERYTGAASPPPVPPWSVVRARLERAAARYASSLEQGSPVGVIVVPRLGLRTMVVDGTDTSDLRKGPGLDTRSSLPGRGRLTYIAGHRTTFGAPFAAIDSIRAGDPAELRLPYATFRYVVTGHRIVTAGDLSVLQSPGHELLVLQACHPRFFASHRYLVEARLKAVVISEQGRTETVRVSS